MRLEFGEQSVERFFELAGSMDEVVGGQQVEVGQRRGAAGRRGRCRCCRARSWDPRRPRTARRPAARRSRRRAAGSRWSPPWRTRSGPAAARIARPPTTPRGVRSRRSRRRRSSGSRAGDTAPGHRSGSPRAGSAPRRSRSPVHTGTPRRGLRRSGRSAPPAPPRSPTRRGRCARPAARTRRGRAARECSSRSRGCRDRRSRG